MVLKKLQPLLLVGCSGTLAILVLQRTGWLDKLISFVRPSGEAAGKGADTSRNVEVIKEEQERLWAAVSAIRNAQDEIRALIATMEKVVISSLETNTQALCNVQEDIEKMKEQAKGAEGDFNALVEAVTVEKFSSLKELESSLVAVEDRVERESAAAMAALNQLREEVPVQIEKHGQAVAEKLGKFKDDLRALVEKLAASNSRGTGRGKR
jgi:hypothetical protein